MKATVIIQARYASTRLPGKVLIPLKGKTVIEHVIGRCKNAQTIDNVIVATSHEETNEKIVNKMNEIKQVVFRGSENDVLDRYYKCAKQFSIKHIVRITSDCPIIDPFVIDTVVQRYFQTHADYCSNAVERTYPDGQDVEVFSFETLEKTWKNAKLLSEREHVTSYIRTFPELFKIEGIVEERMLGNKRWTLDQNEDLEFIRKIMDALYDENPCFSMESVLAFLEKEPNLEKTNSHIEINEGYKKSLEKDKEDEYGKRTKII
ncbi:MAG: glycosyltransferase family protein [Candidatus Omnitrophica bacterium]|nr:glycosyltransferase family protein [Candidatus Omnitrophota bacterium]